MILDVAKWVAGRIMRLIPECILGRVLPGEFRFDPDETPAPPRPPETAVRLFIAPVNYAGQGWYWARAVESHRPDASAVSMVVRMGADFRHPADNVVPVGFYAASRRWQKMQRDAVSRGFTHVIVEAGKQPFGAVLDESVVGQVKGLLASGVKVAMLCHGSDIRLPSRHMSLHPDSPFADTMKHRGRQLERIALNNARILQRLDLPVFVSTPDLLLDVPNATWLPTVIDATQWVSDSPPFRREKLVIAHAPSSGPVKGSEVIDRVLSCLDAEGLIDYERVSGIPHSQMPDVIKEADVVVEQLRIGGYGVAACEAMAAGRIVIGNVSDHVRNHVRSSTGMDVPIIEASSSTLEATVRRVVNDRSEMVQHARLGPEFVNRVHGGDLSVSVLAAFLDS